MDPGDKTATSPEDNTKAEEPKKVLWDNGRFLDQAGRVWSMISKSIRSGKITPSQGREMRRLLGITQSLFTGKKRDKAKAKRIRKMKKASRRRNRGLGKGQKRIGGKRFTSAKT